VLGGNMWSNRDLYGWQPTNPHLPGAHINGSTAVAEEDGKDVVYVAAYGNTGATDVNLYRYVINDLAVPASDGWQRVGSYWNGTAYQGAAALDARRRLFVRTGDAAAPFVMWDLATAGPDNRDKALRPTVVGDTLSFGSLVGYGMDYDPNRDAFVLWGGGAKVWQLRAPGPVGGAWVLERLPLPTQTPVPGTAIGNGVLGKWKYIPNLDAFIALHDNELGEVWLYKPFGWRDPRGGTNQYPLAAITSPANGAVLDAPATIPITADASDPDGSVAQVQFFAGSTLLASLTAPPYVHTLADVPAGTYLLTARASDDTGAITTSATVSVTVRAPNQAPTVALTSPAPGASFTAPATVNLAATASDPDGTIARVQFFAGGTLLATDSSAPYSFSWKKVQPGTYTVTAQATDNAGKVGTSAPVTIVVKPANLPPTVALTSPAAASVFVAPASIPLAATAADADGSVSLVRFYRGSTLLASVNQPPFEFNWTGVAAGSYSLTAKATDSAGAVTTSAAVAISVVNQIPAPPSQLSVGTLGSTSVALVWTDNSNNEQGFKLQRSTNGTSWSAIATLGANVTSFTDTGRSPNKTYHYRVRSYNQAGSSDFSNVLTVTTLP
jgi:hypothetical protein